MSTHHVAGGSERFFADVQSCYERFTDDPVQGGLPAADDVPDGSAELERSGRFGSVECRRFVWEQEYSRSEYLELLSSYSGHRALTTERRDGLYDCIGAFINRAGGSITKRYLNQLSVGISFTKPLHTAPRDGENIRAGREITRRLSGLT
ncbi:hypothetical protein [Kribbella sp. HUAS MG21]|uniref:Uncharacterized protein n=1 Tax=Kribbella sp. HUAS MG21 TaxID=3160966 RepID=A0AAU7TCQ7_9ACTN